MNKQQRGSRIPNIRLDSAFNYVAHKATNGLEAGGYIDRVWEGKEGVPGGSYKCRITPKGIAKMKSLGPRFSENSVVPRNI